MKTWAIAVNTFFEAIRNKVFYIILLFAVVMIFLGLALGSISLGYETQVMVRMGFVAIRFFGILIAMFVGVSLVYDEIERRTLYTLIAHGTSRWQFILGKYLGLLMTLTVNVVMMGLLLIILLLMRREALLYDRIVQQLILIIMEMGVVISFAVFFSSFSTPVLSAVLTFMVWIIGNATVNIQVYIDILENHQQNMALANLLKIIYMPLPHLGIFNLTNDLFAREPFPANWFHYTYAIVYSALILVIATGIFERKDIK